MHPLDDPLAKMQRANEHLDELDSEVVAYQAAYTYTISKELNADKTCYIYMVKPSAVPGARIGTILGDVIHNMRSALDHMVWQLALLTTLTPYRRTEFPIYREKTNENIKELRRILQDVPPEAVDLIERLQPYNAGDGAEKEPLWILHAVWNSDKHRILVPTAHSGWMPAYNGPGGAYEALDDGTIVLTVPIEFDPEMHLEPQITANVCFPLGSPGGGMEVRELLRAIYEALDNLIFPAFSSFFPAKERPNKLRVTLVRQDEPPVPRSRNNE